MRSFDLTDRDKTEATFVDTQIDAVIHFAGYKAVGQSVAEPLSYYENNLDTTLSLLRAMDRHGVRKLVFSSSATVYGAEPVVPMTRRPPPRRPTPTGGPR